MPTLKGVGGLPAVLRLVRVREENIANAEKRSGYELSRAARADVLILASLHSFSTTSQLLGGAFRDPDLVKFIKASEALLEILPSSQYRPPIILDIDENSAVNQRDSVSGNAPSEFVLRNLLEASVRTANELRAKEKASLNKTDVWRMWATAVSQVLGHRNFDTNASHHTDKRKHHNESPFVNFMYELDEEIRSLFTSLNLPEEAAALLPNARVKTGLAREISRAREGRPASLPLREAIAAWRLSNPYMAQANYYNDDSGTVVKEKS